MKIHGAEGWTAAEGEAPAEPVPSNPLSSQGRGYPSMEPHGPHVENVLEA